MGRDQHADSFAKINDVPRSIAAWGLMDDGSRAAAATVAAAHHDGDALAALTGSYLQADSAGRGAANHTIRAYATGIRLLVADWRDVDLLTAGPGDARRWLDSLRANGAWHQDGTTGPAAPATIRVRLAAARALYDALHWAGLTIENPFVETRAGAGSPDSKRRGAYTATEIAALLACADAGERALIILASETGLRVSEICGIRAAHFNLHGGIVTVSVPQKRSATPVAIGVAARGALGLLKRTESDEPLLPWTDSGARKRMRRLCARAGIAYRGIDALRPGERTHRPVVTEMRQRSLFEPPEPDGMEVRSELTAL